MVEIPDPGCLQVARCCVSEPVADNDFGNSLCDSESVCGSESEASWDSEAEVSETDFGLESECLGSACGAERGYCRRAKKKW